MQLLGYVLIGVGFLIGTLASVWQVEGLLAQPYAVGVGLGVVGVFLARSGARRLHQSEERLSENLTAIRKSIAALSQSVQLLNSIKADVSVYDIHDLIDDKTLEDIELFVNARESLAHAFGLQAYADLMSHFAAGERALNRAWSASTDGYIDEVHSSLERACDEFKLTEQQLAQMGATG